MRKGPELAPIFLRAHTRAKVKKKDRGYETEAKPPVKWASFALILDCETTIDIRQDLNFLWWRFCELKDGAYVLQQEGVAHADDLDKPSIELIREFAGRKRARVEKDCPPEILVQSRTEFVNGTFWDAIVAGAAIVCFNAPFDLSRLALGFPEAQSKNTGWSMVLWRPRKKAQKFKPHLRIKPKDSRSAFINLAGGDPNNRVVYRGRFLDLSVLAWALRNKHMTLNQTLKSFGLKGKMEHEPTGRVTKKELAYGRRDVERTLELLNAMKLEYDGFPIDLQPEEAMSAASITKAFLDKMWIKEPNEKYSLPDAIQGKCMQAYYGGRSEIRIRHAEMPVVVCDATSEYPSVAALLDLWPLLTAWKIRVVDCTKEARVALHRASLNELLTPSTWRQLSFFALVKPHSDVLPVRSLYSESGTNIGINPLVSSAPIWFAGPDLAAAKLFGTTPHIIEAFRLEPDEWQPGMKSIALGSRKINPQEDFFRAIIEERKKLPETHPHYLLLKIIANSLYGIFAELNKYEYGKNRAKKLKVFSGEHNFAQTTHTVERPGRWQFPPAAALITAGGRLILAILERMVNLKGGSYLLTDTDSMLIVASEKGGPVPCSCTGGKSTVNAITWKQVEEICAQLNSLNPYDPNVVDSILKIEKCNYDQKGDQQQLYGLAVSAKRYVVYRRSCARGLEIIKPSEHGLGTVYVPDKRKRYKPVHCKDRKTDYPRWIAETWEKLLEDHFMALRARDNAMVARKLWFADLPAIMRIRVTTPNVMAALRKRDPGAAKPYNFAQSPILVDAPPNFTLFAPSSKHPEEWLERDYTEIHSGRTFKLYSNYRGKQIEPQTLSSLIWRHFLHPEAKSLGPDGKPCDFRTSGLLQRRPIKAMLPFRFIGKEVERKAQEGEDISAIESDGPIRYGPGQTTKTRAADPGLILRAKRFGRRQLCRESGVHQHAIERFLNGERIHPSTRERILKAVLKLEQRRK